MSKPEWPSGRRPDYLERPVHQTVKPSILFPPQSLRDNLRKPTLAGKCTDTSTLNAMTTSEALQVAALEKEWLAQDTVLDFTNWILKQHCKAVEVNRELLRQGMTKAAQPSAQSSPRTCLCGMILTELEYQNGVCPRCVKAESDLAAVREELANVLKDWNALVKASGSPTNGGAAGHVAAIVRDLAAAEKEIERLCAEHTGLHNYKREIGQTACEICEQFVILHLAPAQGAAPGATVARDVDTHVEKGTV